MIYTFTSGYTRTQPLLSHQMGGTGGVSDKYVRKKSWVSQKNMSPDLVTDPIACKAPHTCGSFLWMQPSSSSSLPLRCYVLPSLSVSTPFQSSSRLCAGRGTLRKHKSDHITLLPQILQQLPVKW